MMIVMYLLGINLPFHFALVILCRTHNYKLKKVRFHVQNEMTKKLYSITADMVYLLVSVNLKDILVESRIEKLIIDRRGYFCHTNQEEVSSVYCIG